MFYEIRLANAVLGLLVVEKNIYRLYSTGSISSRQRVQFR